MAPDLAHIQSAISLASIPVYFLVAWVLFHRKLWKSYLFFWICLLVEGTALAATYFSAGSRKASLQIYLVAQPIMWMLYVLMVLEVFRKVFARFPGIARFAQRVVLLSMVVAFAFALASMNGDLTNGWHGATLLMRYSVVFRTITSALTLYMVLIAGFLVWMPVPLPPNTIRHSFLFFFYFIVTTGVHYVLNTGGASFLHLANLILAILTLAALLSWLFLLQRAGEYLPNSAPAPRTSAGDILGRLESLNKALSPSKGVE
ncbi:MAG TPA: hypothetical protein VFQ91_01920 [Bryobacteraceae bacterium]|nr:hypothetical protein [Bryobacteraceae bacterium]